MKAECLIRSQPQYRASAFKKGLIAAGYNLASNFKPTSNDVLLIWNRYGHFHKRACEFERAGAKVLVAENGYLGREFEGHIWYAISRNYHNGGGTWFQGDNSRAEKYGASMAPEWVPSGSDVLVLPQRGIGVDPVRQPPGWKPRIITDRPVRVRIHPGENKPTTTLEHDLHNCWCVVTWGSGAALKAAYKGVPVFYDYQQWIGKGVGKRLSAGLETPYRGSRQAIFRDVFNAMWRLDEIERGEPFDLLLRN